MQEKNAVTNEYLKDPEHFADIVNGFVFDGEQLIQSEDVQEKDPVITQIDSNGKKTNSKQVIIDVVQKVCRGMMVTIIHLQNQTDIHYAMPVRVMNEEAAYYHREWRRAASRHEQAKDVSGAEYISGFAKGEKLISAITIVVYWGKKPWDGPIRLKDMLDVENYPAKLQKLIVDYPIHLLEVRKFEDLDNFKTDLKYVFGFLQRDEDKAELEKYVEKIKKYLKNCRKVHITS